MLQLLTSWLEETLTRIGEAEKGTKSPSDTMKALRDLQSFFNPLILSDETDSKIQFIAFFLNSYIDTVFMDLLGDIPYDGDEILQSIRIDFFKKIHKGFEDLYESLRKESDPLLALQDLVSYYSEAVNMINFKDIQMEGKK